MVSKIREFLVARIFLRLPFPVKNILLEIFSLLRFGYPLGYWKILQIEINSDCNRDCWFCWRNKDHSTIRKTLDGLHVREKMSSGLVFKIINQAHNLGFTGDIAFHFLNEPMLDNRLFVFAKYAKQLGMKTRLTTNGDVLKAQSDPQYFEMISECFDMVHIGLYDFSSEEEKMEAQIMFLSKLYKVKHLDFLGGMRQATKGADEDILNKKYSMTINDFINSANTKRCEAPSYQFVIRYDGKIVPSCSCGDDFAIGDMKETTLRGFWFSKKHIDLIKVLSKKGGRLKIPQCSTCPDGGDYKADVLDKINIELNESKDYFLCSPNNKVYQPKGGR